VTVREAKWVNPHLVRVTLEGTELAGMTVPEPAASVRLLLPTPSSELVIPAWNGNEFLLPDGTRPGIRTFTPRRLGPQDDGMEVDVVVHEAGLASAWARQASPGAVAAVSGPGRGYAVDGDATAFLLAGDQTAIPAIAQLLEVLPGSAHVHVCIEIAHADARVALPAPPRATVEWWELADGARPGDALVDAVVHAEPAPGTRIWVAGEAAAVQRIRRHLFDERAVPRANATIRGYWKHGRSGGADPT
jgi:NADPH-dependent ferric siderophore reductase